MARTQIDSSLLANISANNILINGGMEIWQRNTTFSSPATLAYTADRWSMSYNSTPTFTVSREATNVDRGTYALKLDITNASSSTALRIQQLVENYVDYCGKTVTFSCRVKASATNKVSVEISDGVSSNVTSSRNVTTSYETLSISMAIASNASALSCRVGYNTGDTPSISTVYIDSAMLVIGSQPATYQPRLMAQELALCQRYCEKSYATDVAPGTNTNANLASLAAVTIAASVNATSEWTFRVTKYAVPTVTLYSPTGTSGQWVWTSAAGVATSRVTTTSSIGLHVHGFGVNATTTDTLTYGHFIAESEM